MFERITQLADAAATRVSLSRRGFLGRLGQGALGAVGVLGGLLLFPRDARADGSVLCCHYACKPRGYIGFHAKTTCQKAGTPCAATIGSGCELIGSSTAATCSDCNV
jgi:hypothetical protein